MALSGAKNPRTSDFCGLLSQAEALIPDEGDESLLRGEGVRGMGEVRERGVSEEVEIDMQPEQRQCPGRRGCTALREYRAARRPA